MTMPPSPIDRARGYEVVWPQVSPLFEAARGYEDACFVYAVTGHESGMFKIGKAADPISRLRQMQTGNPTRLRIEYVVLGKTPLEKLLHQLWEPFSVVAAGRVGKPDLAPGTEWFHPEAQEVAFPMLEDIAMRHVDLLTNGNPTYADFEQEVRFAHAASGYVAQRREPPRLLAMGNGYSIQRPNRI